jgi:hypothetical protein
MKRTYRISPDGKRPSDEEIARHKDHPRLLANYNKALNMIHRRPIYKDPRAFLAILLIVLLAWLITEAGEKDREPQQDDQEEVGP